MKRVKIHFSPNDILKKTFKRKFKGYDPNDVDSFLDMVISDYKIYQQTANDLQRKNIQLEQENKKLMKGANSQKREGSFHYGNESQVTQADLNDLRQRVSRLESKVFGSGK